MPQTFDGKIGHSTPFEKDGASQLAYVHPLKQAQENSGRHQHRLNMQMLRDREGLSAPLKISMELNAVRKIGHLPFIPSNNVHRDVLLGRDECIEFHDFLGTDIENNRQPHAVMEKKLGIW